MKNIFIAFVLLLALQARPARAEAKWPAEQGNFALCMLNAPSGFYVGTETKGLWRRSANGDWQQFTAQNGLGDDTVRCLLSRGNQIWAGHGRGGLSVWDGANWTTISLADGLPSERVNDLALAANGDVWVATDGGLCRWSDNNGWTMPASALTRRQIVAVAGARGNVWAATACDGLMVSRDDGTSWTQIAGASVQPTAVSGAGLPSNVLNDVAVDELGQIWVATDLGLALSTDEGANWFYLRGDDWKANVRGNAAPLEVGSDEAPVEVPGEDWVQSLATDGDGHIWLGFRQKGAEMRGILNGELVGGTRFLPGRAGVPGDDWVRAIYPMQGGRALLARYGGGIGNVLDADWPAPPAPEGNAKFAVPGAFPTLSADAIAQISALPGAASFGAWNMDYLTRGDWVGRYGDRLAWVYELPWERRFERDPGVNLAVELGPHQVPNGGGPYTYIESLSGEDPRVLYNPAIGTRRMDEINDASWQHDKYPFSWEGPDLWVTVDVPAGAHRVSIYFVNSNGHSGIDRYRDFVLHLKPPRASIAQSEAAPDLARCRVSDFWDGVYASFAVAGPGQYRVKVERHRSHVAKFSGIFVDRIGATTVGENERPFPSMRDIVYQTQAVPAPKGDEKPIVSAARAAWQRLDEAAAQGTASPDDWRTRQQLLRTIVAANADENLQFNWRWKLGLWTESDRAQFAATMAQIEEKRQASTAAKP